MPENLLIPSVDLRIGSLEEYNRQQKLKAGSNRHMPKPRPCVTVSREYGCEGYPVAELLREMLMRKTGEEWVLIDRAVLEELARRHNISEEILMRLGEKNRILNEVLSTFSPRWTSDQDYFRMLCRHVVSLAEQGNVIIVELGGAIITRHFENAHHFRLYASQAFKVGAIARRLGIPVEDAEKIVEKQQRLRDRFTKDFLGQDDHDSCHYDLLFNNDRNTPEKIAMTIADHITAG
ncbi:MAG: cytidylate kinase-like family protein [Geobacteraceae bacterium]|nr:cytidylate kinase-like family protein [Geobacteraceae bacterium]